MGWRGVDIRRGIRVAFECVVIVRRKDTNLVFKTHTENLCVGGICVILQRALLKNTAVEVELYLPDDPIALKTGGKVVWSIRRNEFAKNKPYQFDTGIEFIGITDDDKARLRHIIEELLEY